MGSKTYGAVISLRIPGELLEKLDKQSGNRSAYIVGVLTDALKRGAQVTTNGDVIYPPRRKVS